MMHRASAASAQYDPFAWIYERSWGGEFHSQILSVLDRIALRRLPPGAHIIDLCCGTGRLTEQLVNAGFTVTGIDGSAEMLRFARSRVPGSALIHSDMRTFSSPAPADAVVSSFDSLNHLLSIEDLTNTLSRTSEALREDGVFVFDVNRDEAYRELWVRPYHIFEEDVVQIARGAYDQSNGMATCEVTLFRLLEQHWQRSDFTLQQRCYPHEQIEAALRKAGFNSVTHYDASDVGMHGHIAFGRSFYEARKNGSTS